MKALIAIINFIPNKFKKKFYIFYITSLITNILEIIGIGMLLPVLNFILKKKTGIVALDDYIKVYDLSDFQFTLTMLGIIIIIFILKNILTVYINIFQTRYTSEMSYAISKNVFEQYLLMPLKYSLSLKTAQLLRNTNSEVFIFVRYVVLSIVLISTDITMLLFFLILLMKVSSESTIIILLLFISIAIIIYFFNKKKLTEYGIKRSSIAENIYRFLREGFDSIRELKTYDANDYFIKRYEKEVNKLIPMAIFSNLISFIPKAIFEIFSVLAFVMIIIFATVSNIDFVEIIPKLTIFMFCIYRISPSIARILQNFQKMKHYIVSFYNVKKVYDDNVEALASSTNSNETSPENFFKNISLKDISFKYGKNLILNNINLNINSGSKILFSGKSGAGKSTLLDLIAGFADPSSGEIFLNDKNTTKVYPKKIIPFVSYVSQKTFFLDSDLSSNIAFGKDNFDSQKILHLLEIVELNEFSEKLKKGINVNLGEGGMDISGGEKQRVALARALYFNPQILILDEATNSIDHKTEIKILNNIFNNYKKLSIIMVSHSSNGYNNLFDEYNVTVNGLNKIK